MIKSLILPAMNHRYERELMCASKEREVYYKDISCFFKVRKITSAHKKTPRKIGAFHIAKC
jgi:hypothetical protein